MNDNLIRKDLKRKLRQVEFTCSQFHSLYQFNAIISPLLQKNSKFEKSTKPVTIKLNCEFFKNLNWKLNIDLMLQATTSYIQIFSHNRNVFKNWSICQKWLEFGFTFHFSTTFVFPPQTFDIKLWPEIELLPYNLSFHALKVSKKANAET